MAETRLISLLYGWRVRSGTLAVILVLWLSRPTWSSLAAGAAVAAVGLGWRAWAAGHLRKEKELTVSGPYRLTRNPLYLGNIIIGVGAAVASASWAAGVVLTLYFALFYPVIIIREMRRMTELFPEKYVAYRALVPAFLPSLRRLAGGRSEGFEWSSFRRNKEWRAWLGSLVLWGLLAARVLLV